MALRPEPLGEPPDPLRLLRASRSWPYRTLIHVSRQRERHRERRSPAAAFAEHGDRPSVQRHELLDDRQADAESRPHDLGFRLEERLEQMLELRGGNALPRVAHLHRHQLVVWQHLHADACRRAA